MSDNVRDYLCPFCGSNQVSVSDSRPFGTYIRRRRICMECNKKHTTYEMQFEKPKDLMDFMKYKEDFKNYMVLLHQTQDSMNKIVRNVAQTVIKNL